MIKKYPSKVSYTLLMVVFLAFFIPFIPNLIQNEFNMELVGVLCFLLIVFAFILHLFLKTVYTVDGGVLKIKCGMITYKPISLSEIREVSRTNRWDSSPAPSFDRIEIKYGRNQVIFLSPKDKVNFTKDLTAINGEIINNIGTELRS
jgi:hypothetical protein